MRVVPVPNQSDPGGFETELSDNRGEGHRRLLAAAPSPQRQPRGAIALLIHNIWYGENLEDSSIRA